MSETRYWLAGQEGTIEHDIVEGTSRPANRLIISGPYDTREAAERVEARAAQLRASYIHSRIPGADAINSALRLLSRKEVAERIGISPDSLSRYRLPDPDGVIGTTRGWLPETIDTWIEERPGRGARTDLR